ncbi:urease accessory protein UreD [Aspergillus undulatus]|uniref:urease accessory protein UreD n=1 Tax=Aspergillus undulatus TaxID=1810928 RepID=UPI003CCD68A7
MTTAARQPQLGVGQLEVHAFCGFSSISTLSSTYPLKLVSPPCRPVNPAALAFMMSYGGGLVAGDSVDLKVTVESQARLALLTQGSTKVYRTPSRSICSRQKLTVGLEDDAALLLLPDPLQPFKDSAYKQCQTFHIQSSSSLTRNDVWALPDPNKGTGRKLLIRDSLALGDASSLPGFGDEMDDLGVFGTLILRGPVFRTLGEFFLAEFSRLPRIGPNGQRVDEDASRLDHSVRTWTAACIRGAVVVKFGAQEVDAARHWLRGMLQREGTVEKVFGAKSLLCLQ